MKKLILFLCLLLFIGCEKLNKEAYEVFSYDESVSSYGTVEDNLKNWNLSCEGLKCKIAYSKGSPLRILYEKEIILKNDDEKKELVNLIIKGIKNGKNYSDYLDYQPNNHLVLNNKKEYNGQTVNEEFLKILNELLEQDYKEIEKNM